MTSPLRGEDPRFESGWAHSLFLSSGRKGFIPSVQNILSEMKSNYPLLACLFVLLVSCALSVYAQDRDRSAVSLGSQIRNIFGGYTCNIFCFVALSIGGVASLIILYSGFMYVMHADDPSERDFLKKRMVYVLGGLILFAFMIPVVNYLTGVGSAGLSPFGCNCLKGGIEISDPVIVGTTLPGLNVFIVKPKEGEELDMDRLASFLAVGYGGTPPYAYKWISSLDGNIGFADSFMWNLSRGNHTIICELTDSIGNYTSDDVHVSVVVPKPRPN